MYRLYYFVIAPVLTRDVRYEAFFISGYNNVKSVEHIYWLWAPLVY